LELERRCRQTSIQIQTRIPSTKEETIITEIKITRRIALDKPYEYYELQATYESSAAKVAGNKVIKDIEKQVAFIRKLTVTEEPEVPKTKPKKTTKKKAAVKEAGKTEDIKIADLQKGDKGNLTVRLVRPIDPEKDIKAFINKTDGSAGKRCKTIVEDEYNGKISLTLFDKQIDLVQTMKENAWFTIENGYVKDWEGNLELVVGRYGKIEVVFDG